MDFRAGNLRLPGTASSRRRARLADRSLRQVWPNRNRRTSRILHIDTLSPGTSTVTLDFSRPGKPTDNAFIESLNGKFRAECLNAHWFTSLDDARVKCEA